MKRTYLKFCSFALALVMVLAAFAGTFTINVAAADVYSAAWDGTTVDTEWTSPAANVYYITSAAELAGLAQQVNNSNDYAGVTFYVTKNIDLNNKEWTPIGKTTTAAACFKGNLVGALDYTYNAGHNINTYEFTPIKIKGFYLTYTANNAGLIGSMTGGSVRNMTMINPVIDNGSRNTTACFVGYVKTTACTFQNLRVEGGSITKPGTKLYVGGIVAYVNIPGCVFDGCSIDGLTINAPDTWYVGGILGYSSQYSLYTDCHVNNSTVIGETAVGGILGKGSRAAFNYNVVRTSGTTTVESATPMETTITVTNSIITGGVHECEDGNCQKEGDPAACPINTQQYSYVGAVAGWITNGDSCAHNCQVTGTTVNGYRIVGGVIAYITATRDLTNLSFDGTINTLYETTVTPSVTLDTDGTTVTALGRSYSGFKGSAGNFTVGGIIGSNSNAKLVNCVSNATIVNVNGAYIQTVGGLVGAAGTNSFFEDCVFTGKILSNGESASSVGGFIGYKSNFGADVDFDGCVMTGLIDLSDSHLDEAALKAEYVAAYKAKNTEADDTAAEEALNAWLTAKGYDSFVDYVESAVLSKQSNGVGGFVGEFDQNELKFVNCYYGGKMFMDQERRVGGFVGFYRLGENWNDNGTEKVTFVDCQMDGIVTGKATQIGAFIGRANGDPGTAASSQTSENADGLNHTETEGVFTDVITYGGTEKTFTTDADVLTGCTAEVSFTRCLMTGVASQGYGSSRAYAWIGSSAGFTGSASYIKINIENCYSNSKMPVIGNSDAGALAVYASINGGNWTLAEASDSFTNVKPAALNASALTTLNNGGTLWQQAANDETPELEIANDVARPYAKADMTWFDMGDVQESYDLDTEAKMLGAAMLSYADRFYGVTLNATAAAVENMTEELFNMDKAAMVNVEGVNWKTLDWKWQTKANGENVDVRFVAAVDLEEAELGTIERAGFEITYGDTTTQIDTMYVYTSIQAGGDVLNNADLAENFGSDATYYMAAIVTGAPVGAEVTVRAYVVIEGDTIYGAAVTSNIPAAE